MYQELESEFQRMGIYDDMSQRKIPPAVAPKPKKNFSGPTPYRPGPAPDYRSFGHEDDFPPPPLHEDDDNFPPPPPPEQIPVQVLDYDSPAGHHGYSHSPERLRNSQASPVHVQGSSPGYKSNALPRYSAGPASPSSGYSGSSSPRYEVSSQQYYSQQVLPGTRANTQAQMSYHTPPAPYSPKASTYSDTGVEYANTSSLFQRGSSNMGSKSPVNIGKISEYDPSEGYSHWGTESKGRQSPVQYMQKNISPGGRVSPYNPSNTYANLPAYTEGSPRGPAQGTTQYSRTYSNTSEGFSPRLESESRPLPGPQVPIGEKSGVIPQQSSLLSPSSDRGGQEAEVDALTNLLMQNMEASKEEDYFGMCYKCGQKVVGDNGCTANEQVYHINCFTCLHCGILLRGKSFFSLDNKPYCEKCYVNTLERCSVCSKPITDRLLRATGKPYHPDCFTCVVCGKSLDGIPFTVDATNQIHCIEDFHRKFAPRCSVCQLPIMPEKGQDETVRVVALDRSFHIHCYRCEDCDAQLSSEADGQGCYPLDDHILCKTCNAKRIQILTSKMATDL